MLFDYGLVLTGPPSPGAWERMLTLTDTDEAAFHAAYWAPRHGYDRGTHTGAEYWTAVGAHAGLVLSPGQIDALIAADTELWTQPNQPMIDWAARLQAAGTPTGVLSNLGDSITEGVLAKLPWLSGFRHLTFSHALRLAKPEPAIYAHAADGLGIPPQQILFVDDRADNIDGATAAGMRVIRYTDHALFVAALADRGWIDLWLTGRIPM